jgi:hypothetical protein
MGDESRRAGIRRLVEAISAREMEPFDTIYNDDVLIEWPQSGEVIRGKQNIVGPAGRAAWEEFVGYVPSPELSKSRGCCQSCIPTAGPHR